MGILEMTALELIDWLETFTKVCPECVVIIEGERIQGGEFDRHKKTLELWAVQCPHELNAYISGPEDDH